MYLQVKKDTKYLTRKINQLIACTNAEIERGRGGKRFFPPTKEIGTREADRSGKGKYFPQWKTSYFYPILHSYSKTNIFKRKVTYGGKTVFISGTDTKSYFGPNYNGNVEIWHLSF